MATKDEVISSSLIFNKQSFASGFFGDSKRRELGLPPKTSFKKRTRRRRGKQNLRKKG